MLAHTKGNAFVVDATAVLKAIRAPGDFGERDFIYQTNNYLTDDMKPAREGTRYGLSSDSRNKPMFHFLTSYPGKIDVALAKMMFRYPGYQKIGSPLSMRQVIAQPRAGDRGVAYICTGQASPPEVYSDTDNYLVAPTRSFYKLNLASSPADVSKAAKHEARAAIATTYKGLRESTYSDSGYTVAGEIFSRSVEEYYQGVLNDNKGWVAGGDTSLGFFARATAFARSQAHALQVRNLLSPPATRPSELGLSGIGSP